MAPRRTLVAVLATSGLAAAQNATAFTGPGPYPEGQDFLEDAPVTNEKTVPFDLYYPNDGNAPTWQFTTRLEEGAPPDSLVPNAAVLNTVYDFGYPTDGNLSDAVAANSGQLDVNNFCVTVLESLLPNSEANRYNPDTEDNASDSSCNYVLRDECIDAIRDRVAETEPAEDGCRFSNVDLLDIVQCEWIFNEDSLRLSTYNLMDPELSGNLTGGFAHMTSDPYDSTNRTFVDLAETRIHMVVIDSGNTFTPLCVRVDETRDQTAGASITSASMWLAATAMLGALAYIL